MALGKKETKATVTLYDADRKKLASHTVSSGDSVEKDRYFAAGDYYLKVEYAGGHGANYGLGVGVLA